MSKVLIELDDQGRIIINKLDKETLEAFRTIKENKNNIETITAQRDTSGGICGAGCS